MALATDAIGSEWTSYLGFQHIARALARWGIHAFSLRLDGGGTLAVDPAAMSPDERSEFLIAAIEEIRGRAPGAIGANAGFFDQSKVGLAGLSFGGEAVVLAEAKLATTVPVPGALSPPDVRAIVALAPVRHPADPTLPIASARALVLFGSDDYKWEDQDVLLGDYDITSAAKTLASMRGVTHEHNNQVWSTRLTSPSLRDSGLIAVRDSPFDLPRALQAEITAVELVTASMVVELLGFTGYEGYLAGTAIPRWLHPGSLRLAHRPALLPEPGGPAAPTVIDEFDGSNEWVNQLGGAVLWTGADAIVDAEPLEGYTLARTSEPAALRLRWVGPEARYETTLPVATAMFGRNLTMQVALTGPGAGGREVLVALGDGAGRSAFVRLGAAAVLGESWKHGEVNAETWRTLSLCIDAFTAANPHFDPLGVISIALDTAPGFPAASASYLEQQTPGAVETDEVLIAWLEID